jgi:hypothetical protein
MCNVKIRIGKQVFVNFELTRIKKKNNTGFGVTG